MVKAADPEHADDTSFKIGVVNLDGVTYRVAAGSPGEMLRVGDALTALGFASERPEGVHFTRGFQALYDRAPVVE